MLNPTSPTPAEQSPRNTPESPKYTEQQLAKARDLLAEMWDLEQDEFLTDRIKAVAEKAGFVNFDLKEGLAAWALHSGQSSHVNLAGDTKWFFSADGSRLYTRGDHGCESEARRLRVGPGRNNGRNYSSWATGDGYWAGAKLFTQVNEALDQAERDILKLMEDAWWSDIYGNGKHDPAEDFLDMQAEAAAAVEEADVVETAALCAAVDLAFAY